MRIPLAALFSLCFVILAGCTTTDYLPGAVASNSVQNAYMTNTGVALDGTTPVNFTNVYTRSLTVSTGTEVSAWVKCVGNITTLAYEVSPDESYWINGTNSLAPCNSNNTKYDFTDKAFKYVRFRLQSGVINNGNSTNSTNLTILVSQK